MNIRQATINDLKAIVDIYNQAISAGKKTADTLIFSAEQRQEWFKEHKADSFPLLVAVEKEQVIGYLTLSPYRNGRPALSKTAEISYYIDFNHLRKGIGSKLMEYAIHLAKELNLNSLIAILVGSNQGSIKLLQKYGFKQWGCMPGIVYFGDSQHDHVYYGLHLKST